MRLVVVRSGRTKDKDWRGSHNKPSGGIYILHRCFLVYYRSRVKKIRRVKKGKRTDENTLKDGQGNIILYETRKLWGWGEKRGYDVSTTESIKLTRGGSVHEEPRQWLFLRWKLGEW